MKTYDVLYSTYAFNVYHKGLLVGHSNNLVSLILLSVC